jgi:hypothetical protein
MISSIVFFQDIFVLAGPCADVTGVAEVVDSACGSSIHRKSTSKRMKICGSSGNDSMISLQLRFTCTLDELCRS